MEREDVLIRAALTAFSEAFPGARVVERDLELGEGPRWAWLAELSNGGLCVVRVVDEARAEEAWTAIDGLARLVEVEPQLRRALGLAPLDRRLTPRAVVIAQNISAAFVRRVELVERQRLEAFALVRINTRQRSWSELISSREVEQRAQASSQPRRSVESELEFKEGVDVLVVLQQRLSRLDPLVEIEQDADASVFRVHGHELARVHASERLIVARVGADLTPIPLHSAEDVEAFLARVVDRYLELGCWSGAEGGAASLALVEPLLTHEELAAFRELG